VGDRYDSLHILIIEILIVKFVFIFVTCSLQVIIRKMNENNFIVEGPPCKALYVAKRVVYKRFSFL
jgi:hypothetical protein